MRKSRFAAFVCTITIAISCVTGCGDFNFTEDDQYANDVAFISMEEEPSLDYEVPKSIPHILVDQLGYLPEGSKQVIFYGEELPTSFQIVDADSDITVYFGSLDNQSFDEERNTNVACGDFGDFTTEGEYYIRADKLGVSYHFEIRNGIYDDIFTQSCKTYYYNRCGITLTETLAGEYAHNACHTGNSVLREDMNVNLDVTGGWHQDESGSKNVESASKTLATMLLAYEIFPDAFSDNIGIPESDNQVPDILDEARYEVDWLWKMQNPETGEVYSAVSVSDKESEGKNITSYVEMSTPESCRAFAFVMAKFGYLYQNFDKEYATSCLQAADRAWKYAELNDENADSVILDDKAKAAQRFAAAAEIYRASGLEEYRKFVEEYLKQSNPQNAFDNEMEFYGAVTYINTKQPVDTEICGAIIKPILKKAEDISAKARESKFLVPGNVEQSDNAELLNQMIYMTLVDYIISNHEYDTIIENYLHYFLGRNHQSITYMDNVGSHSYKDIHGSLGLMKQFDSDSKLIFMLSKVITGYQIKG